MTPEEQNKKTEGAILAIERKLHDLERLESEAAQFIGTDQYFENEVESIRYRRRYVTGEQLKRFIVDFFKNHTPRTRLVYDGETSIGRLYPDEKLKSFITDHHKSSYLARFLATNDQGVEVTFDAQVAFRNPKRDGLHAVIDFGAGTTDFSIFNLENVGMRGAVKKFWYAARNLPRGAQRIERIVSLYLEHTGKGQNVTDSHVVQAVLKINKLPDKLKYEIKQELKELWEESHAVWRQSYSYRSRQSEWEKDKVHVLVCGGGAKAPFIKEIFSKSWMKDWGPYPIYPLPIPDDYDTMDDKAPFDRMSVAYGLCQPLPSLGDYTLPNDSPDQTPPRLPIREMSEWDERIPRSGWLG